jgi:hypothetical protein
MEVEIRTDLPAKIKRKDKCAAVSVPREAGLSPGVAMLGSVKAPKEEEASPSGSAPLVELEVLRIPPNPRLVIARYQVCGEERRCMVNVGRNSNFVPKMKFRLPEPSDPTALSKPWPFAPNRLPRRRGRW